MSDADADTAAVQVTVSPLVPVSGRGEIKFLASVQLDIGGVVIELSGWTLRQDKRGRMRAFLPAFRDPRTGAWEACVTLPDDLLRAVGEALLAQAPGGEMLLFRFMHNVRRPAIAAQRRGRERGTGLAARTAAEVGPARAQGPRPRRPGQELPPGRARGRAEQEHRGRDREAGTLRSHRRRPGGR